MKNSSSCGFSSFSWGWMHTSLWASPRLVANISALPEYIISPNPRPRELAFVCHSWTQCDKFHALPWLWTSDLFIQRVRPSDQLGSASIVRARDCPNQTNSTDASENLAPLESHCPELEPQEKMLTNEEWPRAALSPTQHFTQVL